MLKIMYTQAYLVIVDAHAVQEEEDEHVGDEGEQEGEEEVADASATRNRLRMERRSKRASVVARQGMPGTLQQLTSKSLGTRRNPKSPLSL